MTERNIRFAHIRKDRHTSIGGGITIAFYQEGPQIKFSVSSCTPKDNFCKKIGRDRAMEAMNRGEVSTISMSTVKALRGDWRDMKYPKDYIYALFG